MEKSTYRIFERPILKRQDSIWTQVGYIQDNLNGIYLAPRLMRIFFQTSNYKDAVAVVIDLLVSGTLQRYGNVHMTVVMHNIERYGTEISILNRMWYSALTEYVGLRPLDEEYIFRE